MIMKILLESFQIKLTWHNICKVTRSSSVTHSYLQICFLLMFSNFILPKHIIFGSTIIVCADFSSFLAPESGVFQFHHGMALFAESRKKCFSWYFPLHTLWSTAGCSACFLATSRILLCRPSACVSLPFHIPVSSILCFWCGEIQQCYAKTWLSSVHSILCFLILEFVTFWVYHIKGNSVSISSPPPLFSVPSPFLSF